MSIAVLLAELNARLPEITWKINQLQKPITAAMLPRGLFTIPIEYDSSTFIDEIKADIKRLSTQKNEQVIRHLANTIQRKINVLVKICQLNQVTKAPAELARKNTFNLSSLSTRQQWLGNLEEKITALTEQKEAFSKKVQNNADPLVQLQLQKEIGELEKQLTLAKEAYQKATRVY